jgi:enediyne biosynthesis protein E3
VSFLGRSALLKRLLRIRLEEATFARRGFRSSSREAQARLERVGERFLYGYHAALEDRGMEALTPKLESVESEFRGFAYEGAAMALDLLDQALLGQLKPWRASRVRQFLNGPGAPHIYMVHVGMGWSMARLRLGMHRRLARLDPLLRWLVLDGCGFHEGYFHWRRYSGGVYRPKWLRGYASRAFDQGLGRSLWFVGGADPQWIVAAVASFPEARRADLWSGIGLACSYAGAPGAGELGSMRMASGIYRNHLAQGAVFAAGARQRAGNPAPHTELACRILCGISAREAAAISDETVLKAREDYEPAYEVWRRLIRMQFRDLEPARRITPEAERTARVRAPGLQEGSQYVQ